MSCLKSNVSKLALAIGAMAAMPCLSHAAVITQWNFPAAVGAPDNSPPPTTGTGTAKGLNMTNNYMLSDGSTFSVESDDINSSSGVANPSFSEFTWRVRGNGSGGGNGWSLSAPQYSQGAEFDAATTGFSNVMFSFDWYCTNQGIKNMQVQYTTNGSTWNNAPGGALVATANDFANTSNPNETINLTGVAGVDNNPNFGIRLVSAYDTNPADPASTGGPGGTPTYAAAVNSGVYNNNSGNWRFGDITFSGTSSVPEPASGALLLTGAFGLIGRRRRAK